MHLQYSNISILAADVYIITNTFNEEINSVPAFITHKHIHPHSLKDIVHATVNWTFKSER